MGKLIRSKVFWVASLACVAALMLLPAGAAKAWDGEGEELRGAWNITITQTNCETGQALGPSFQAMNTFAQGGTMLETTASPAFAVGQRSVGNGFWRFDGRRTYLAKSKAFINFTTPATMMPPNPGFEAGYQILSQTIEFPQGDRNHWSSAATTQFYDPNNNLYRSGCAVAAAERFE
jgi:hypothetical protein